MADGKKANGKPAGKDGSNKDAVVAKAAGFVVFTGIALSLFKALQPKKPVEEFVQSEETVIASSVGESSDGVQVDSKLGFEQDKVSEVRKEANGFGLDFGKKFQKGPSKKKVSQIVEIYKGDTLWGLSRKYGVSIESIKAANGFSDDTIYAGEKITIPG